MLVLAWMAAHLSYGIALVMLLVPAAIVGPRFYRLNLGIAAILLSVTTLVQTVYRSPSSAASSTLSTLSQFHPGWVCLGLCVVLVLLSAKGVGTVWYRGLCILGGAAGVVAMIAESIDLARDASAVSLALFAYLAALLSSALLLGAVLVSMNLGHWYLVVLDLPFRYLRQFTMLLIAAVIVKFLAAGLTLFLFGRQFPEAVSATTTNFISGNALFFWARVVLGLVAPLILAAMIWATVKIRSNQSATGLLYVALVFVLFGELFAKYLLATTRLPI